MENATLDGSVSSPSVISPSPGIYNMDNFTFDVSPSANDLDLDLDLDHSTPSLHIPQSSAAKQPKKRKSWGQELPEPKTTLPPRKRAKTDDEKEQRRIERIKRNRAAAHNSRERKRVEAERLEVENHHLKHKLAQMQQHLHRQHAQLTEFQRLVPNALPQLPPLSTEEFNPMSFDLSDMSDIKDESADTPASTVDTIDPRASLSRSTPDISTPFIKVESPSTSIAMPTPSAPATRAPDDLSQHSAAMLYDLQCRSRRSLSQANRWWAQFILCLMHMNIMACYKTLLAATWALWPARMAQIAETAFQSTISSSTAFTKTTTSSSRTTRPTTMTRRQQRRRTVPSATSNTPSSLLTCLSLLLLSQTSAQFSTAKGPARLEANSAASLALLLSRLVEDEKKAVPLSEPDEGVSTDVIVVASLHGSSRRLTDHREKGKRNDGGIG